MSGNGAVQIAISNSGYAYISRDYGVNWTVLSASGLPLTPTFSSATISTNGNYITLFATSQTNSLYVSNNGGTSFSTPTTGSSIYSTNVGMSKDGSFQLYISGDTNKVSVSNNYGGSFSSPSWTFSNPSSGTYTVSFAKTCRYLSMYSVGGNVLYIHNNFYAPYFEENLNIFYMYNYTTNSWRYSYFS